MITHKNLVKHELIGLDVEIRESTDPTLKGLKGTVVDETKNMLTIEVEGKRKMTPKNICLFRFHVNDRAVDVRGETLVAKPQDRTKK